MSLLRNQMLAQLRAELATRSKSLPALDIAALTFPVGQRPFVEDASDFVVACCSRRAGKSTGGRRKLLRMAVGRPGSLSVYVTLTRTSAKRLMWEPLKADLWRLGIAYEANETELTITLPQNGSRIWLAGA